MKKRYLIAMFSASRPRFPRSELLFFGSMCSSYISVLVDILSSVALAKQSIMVLLTRWMFHMLTTQDEETADTNTLTCVFLLQVELEIGIGINIVLLRWRSYILPMRSIRCCYCRSHSGWRLVIQVVKFTFTVTVPTSGFGSLRRI